MFEIDQGLGNTLETQRRRRRRKNNRKKTMSVFGNGMEGGEKMEIFTNEEKC